MTLLDIKILDWQLRLFSTLQLEHPADLPCLLHLAMCSSLCNESSVQYNTERGTYEKIGESTEVALRVLSEKVVSNLLMWLFSFGQLPYASCLHLWIFIFVSLNQVGLPGFDSMPSALTMLSKQERVSYCNHYWEQQFNKVQHNLIFLWKSKLHL
jgi:Ca2+ transporting ATPase